MAVETDVKTNGDIDNLASGDPPREDASSATPPPERDWEAEAKPMGWRPEGVYKGPPEKFISAKEFVLNGEKNLPLINAANRHLREEVERLKRQGREHAELMERLRAQDRAELEAQLAAAKEARKDAITAGDGEAHEVADAAVKKIENDLAAAKAPPKKDANVDPLNPVGDPGLAAWLDAHPRVREEEELQALVDASAKLSKFKHLHNKREEFWDAVYEYATERLDGPPQRKEPPGGPQRGGKGSEGPGTGNRGAPARSYERLTDSMKRTCDRLIKDYGYDTDPKKLARFKADYVSQCTDDAFTN